MTTKKFHELKIGDIIQMDDGRTAKVLSCPSFAVPRGHLGIELRFIGGENELKWSAMRPDSDVFLA